MRRAVGFLFGQSPTMVSVGHAQNAIVKLFTRSPSFDPAVTPTKSLVPSKLKAWSVPRYATQAGPPACDEALPYAAALSFRPSLSGQCATRWS